MAVLSLVIALLAAVPAAGPVSAQAAEHIPQFDVVLTVQGDGSLAVTEQISYDFGPAPRHGIFRDIPVRFDYEPDSRYERLTTIEDFAVTATPPGTSGKVETEPRGRVRRYRIGDPKRTITGVHDYTITYRVKGALDAFADHDELRWNAVGAGWAVPIDAARVTVNAPGAVEQATCFAGPTGSRLTCGSAAVKGTQATFSQGPLAAGDGLTVDVALPKGEVTVPKPILDEQWAFGRAFALTPATGAATAGLLALVAFGLVLIFRRGRARRYKGSAVDVAFGNQSGEEEPVPFFERQHDPVEFEPPDNIRPGQLGTLIDESADPLDVTATIVDLAVRGYLRIEELPRAGWHAKPDWKLHRLKAADGLLPYEALLLDGLFEAGDDVALSALKTTFATRLRGVEDALYDDVTKAGWFTARPKGVRTRRTVIGALFLLVAIIVTVILAAATHAGLLGLPLVAGAAVLVLFAHRAPLRTAKGFGVLRRVNGFRQFIEESEKDRARFAERANLFSEYLPYAVVFGATEKWARAFAGLEGDVGLATGGWYVSSNPFLLASFASSMDGFAVTTSGTIVASAPSSSGGFGGGGGFSGGGFGGGGGGSW